MAIGIGKRIKEARLNKGLTQEMLALLVGVTKGAIANYENGTSHPKEPVMYALIDALGVDANFLFQDCVKIKKSPSAVASALGDVHELSPKMVALYAAMNQLNDHGQEKVLEYADDLVSSGKYI